ncbi:MAG: glycosyltransferase [Thiothrix sp.]|nr:MAG: glycosyltransferase [Thiothrix sp.]
MIKLIYKAAKPYLYPNLINKRAVQATLFETYFSMKTSTIAQEIKAGWYMLELKAKGEFATAELNLHFSEQQSFPITLRAKQLMKRIVYLSKPTIQIELEFKVFGEGDLTQLRLVPIKEQFAVDRMLKRLAGTTESQADIISKIQHRAALKQQETHQVLFAAYNRLFSKLSEADYSYWLEEIELDLIEKFAHAYPTAPSDLDGYLCILNPSYKMDESSQELLIRFLSQHPEAVLVYPDEDQLDRAGNRIKPWFKTDWNHDLFLNQDYISQGFVCRRSWYEQHLSMFQSLGTSQALAFLLPSLSRQQILHLPLVLLHKLYGGQASQLIEPFSATRTNRFQLPEPQPLVSLLIPTRNKLDILKPCVESILEKTSYRNFEILILDNQSSDPEILEWFQTIQSHDQVRVLAYDHPFNYSAINNYGVKQAKGSVIGLINNDVEVISENWLNELLTHACRQEIGCVGAKLYYSNGQIQHAGVILGLGHVAGHAHRFAERNADGYFGRLKLVQNYSAVTAACLVVRREIYEQVGGLNEQDLAVAYNDVDFCLRVQAAGYRNLWTPYAELYHHESVSRGEDDTPEKKARFDKEVAYMRATWAKELENDPYYNPNLSRVREDFSIRDFF